MSPLLLGLAGALVGWFVLPWLVARLPERSDPEEPGRDEPGAEAPGPAEPGPATPHRRTYLTVAASRRARPVLAVLLAGLWVLPLVVPTDVPSGAAFPAYLWLSAVGVALGWVDLRTHKLPDVLTGLALAGTGGLLAVGVAGGAGSWGDFGRCWLAALAMFAGYLVLAVVYPAGMGLGDVKLAPALGLILGWSGWATVLLGGFLGFAVGAVVGVAVVAARRTSLKTAVPFGPSMLVGAWLALAFGGRFLGWYVGA